MVGDTVIHDEYTKQLSEIDKSFRELIFGTMEYLHNRKTRYFAVTLNNIEHVSFLTVCEKILEVKLYSDFIRVLGNIDRFNWYEWTNWNVIRNKSHELTVYDLLLFESPEEVGRIRRNSIDIDQNYPLTTQDLHESSTETEPSLWDQVSILCLFSVPLLTFCSHIVRKTWSLFLKYLGI